MYLSDKDILKEIKTGNIIIRNFDKNRLQPASYDVLLGKNFLIFDKHKINIIDPKESLENQMHKITLEKDDDYFVIPPKEFVLAETYDYFGVNEEYCCRLMGKSSLARLGLIIHTTAGFIDPGNQLRVTLELFNTNSIPIKLYPKMKIAQIAFCQLRTKSSKAYGHKDLNSKYYGSESVESSKMHLNFKKQ